jgi:hypothetical protein
LGNQENVSGVPQAREFYPAMVEKLIVEQALLPELQASEWPVRAT